jgi:hypothetical protein
MLSQVSCVSRNVNAVYADISSYSSDEITLKKEDEICFPRSKYTSPDLPLSEATERDEIVAACEAAAEMKGVRVKSAESAQSGCFYAMINWTADSGTTYQDSPVTTCNRIYQTTICNTH